MQPANGRNAKSRNLVILLGVLGALAVAGVLMLVIIGSPHRLSSEAPDPDLSLMDGNTVESPSLRGRRILDRLDMRRPLPEAAPATESATQGTCVQGAVSSETSGPIEAAEVYAVTSIGERVTLGQASTDTSGKYRMPLDIPATLLAAGPIHVGAIAPGHLRQTAEAKIDEGQDLVLDFVLPRGLALEGRVVDEEGEPVGDLPVFVTARRETPALSRCPVFFATDDLRLARLGSAYHEARGGTDGRGFFRVEGLGEADYAVLTPSKTWLIRQGGGRWQPGDRGVVIVALRAFSLDLEISSPDGEPMPEIAAQFYVRTPGVPGYLMPLGIRGGLGQLTWASMRKGLEHTQGFDVRITLTAQGWESLRHTVSFESGERHKDVALTIKRREQGTVKLTVLDDGGEPVSLPLVANLVAYKDRHNEAMTGQYHNLDLQFAEKPGQYVLSCGVGRWFASITVRHELGAAIRWTGELCAPPGSVPSQSLVTLPTFARVAFTVTGDNAPSATHPLRLRFRSRARGRIVRVAMDSSQRVIDGFPTGTWEYDYRRGDQEFSGEFTVGERDDIQVDLP